MQRCIAPKRDSRRIVQLAVALQSPAGKLQSLFEGIMADTHWSRILSGTATQDDVKRAKAGFWAKLKKFLGRIPFTRDVVALYYLVADPRVDLGIKAAAVLALLYFISPIDVVPDAIPGAGMMDDAAVITAAITALAPLLAPYRGQADDWLAGEKKEEEVLNVEAREVLRDKPRDL
jgi:uncharacterized membrane protein YkvA (DUF1232 family)